MQRRYSGLWTLYKNKVCINKIIEDGMFTNIEENKEMERLWHSDNPRDNNVFFPIV